MHIEQNKQSCFENKEYDMETKIWFAHEAVRKGFYFLEDALHWYGLTMEQYDLFNHHAEGHTA